MVGYTLQKLLPAKPKKNSRSKSIRFLHAQDFHNNQ